MFTPGHQVGFPCYCPRTLGLGFAEVDLSELDSVVNRNVANGTVQFTSLRLHDKFTYNRIKTVCSSGLSVVGKCIGTISQCTVV